MSALSFLPLLLLLAAPAEPVAGDAEARSYFAAGNEAYDAGLFLASAHAYEEAYRRAPLPAIEFSAAQAFRRHFEAEGNRSSLQRAIELYQAYLREVPDGGRSPHAREHLAALEHLQQTLAAEPPPPSPVSTQLLITSAVTSARVSIDGGEDRPIPQAMEVIAGTHAVVVHADGYLEARLQREAVAGRLVLVQVDLEPLPAYLSVRPGGAQILLDGRNLGRTPPPVLQVAAGEHVLTALRRGYEPASRPLTAGRGQKLEVAFDLHPTLTRRVASGLILGAGGAALVAAISGAVALGQQVKLGNLDPSGKQVSPADLKAFDDTLASRDSFRGVALGSLAVGATLAATAGVLWLLEAEPR